MPLWLPACAQWLPAPVGSHPLSVLHYNNGTMGCQMSFVGGIARYFISVGLPANSATSG